MQSVLCDLQSVDIRVAECAMLCSKLFRLQVLLYFLEAFKGEGSVIYPEPQLIMAAKYLIRPMLEKGYEKNAPAIDDEVLDPLVTCLFDSREQSSALSNPSPPSRSLHHQPCSLPCHLKHAVSTFSAR